MCVGDAKAISFPELMVGEEGPVVGLDRCNFQHDLIYSLWPSAERDIAYLVLLMKRMWLRDTAEVP